MLRNPNCVLHFVIRMYDHPEVDTHRRNVLGFFQRSYSIYSRMAVPLGMNQGTLSRWEVFDPVTSTPSIAVQTEVSEKCRPQARALACTLPQISMEAHRGSYTERIVTSLIVRGPSPLSC